MTQSKRSFAAKWIGDRAFYGMVFAIVIPIIVQNGITNFVSLLDNIMVGQVGTEQMSGVAIVNQLIWVYNLCLFGGLSGAGIFTSQYFGVGDMEGIRHTFRYKFWVGIILTAVAIGLLLLQGDFLISAYLNGSGDLAAALHYGRGYLLVMLLGLPPFMFSQLYASTLRECGETLLPMKASLAAVGVNLVFNYLLIYGKLGLPALGVVGAAIATVLSRYVEAAIILCQTHLHPENNPYVVDLYRTLRVPMNLVKLYLFKGSPLLFNEMLWSSGMAVLVQCYSTRGLAVVAAVNISNTLYNVFNVVYISMGNAVAIMVGQQLGAGDMEKARDWDNKLLAFAVFICLIVGALMLCAAPFFPLLYNCTSEVRQIATQFIMVQALFMPQSSYLNAIYFTLRAGGRTIITFFFDGIYIWCVNVVVVFLCSRFTPLPATAILVINSMCDWIKCAVGTVLVKRGIWLRNIVS